MSVAGWLPAEWTKAVVPIAVRNENSFSPIGTGFVINNRNLNCLFTAKHVAFQGNGRRREGLFVLANRIGGGGNFVTLDELGSLGVEWKTHPHQDLAATMLPADPTFDMKRFPSGLFEDFQNITEGDDVFFLGFPLSLGVTTSARVRPIVRTGTVALKNEDQTFLIDANVFPGNSGSPVFLKPCPITFSTQGFEIGRVRPPKLIGVVTSFVSYSDAAISPQTGNVRITFEENSGLGTVLSVRFINDILTSSDFQNMVTAVLEREERARTPPASSTTS